MNFKFIKLSFFQKLLALIVLLVVAYSCSKLDEVPLEINKTSDTRVKDANKLTEWYDKYHKPSQGNLFSSLKPIWNSATMKNVDGRNVYEIKLENPKEIVASLNFSVNKKYERIGESVLKKKQESSTIRLLMFEDPKTAEILGGVYMNIETENDKS